MSCHFLKSFEIFPAEPRESPKELTEARMSLNDTRFNSNWVFFPPIYLKIDIQFQKFWKLAKFGPTKGIIFNSENCKLTWMWKCQLVNIWDEQRKLFFQHSILWSMAIFRKKIFVPRPPRPTGHRCKVCKVGSRFW